MSCYHLILQLKERVEAALEQCKEHGEGSDNARFLAQQLLEQGYQVKLRTALGGCATNSSCLRNLRHVFLTCRLDGVFCSVLRHLHLLVLHAQN